jgi:hypothetical protein
VESILIPAPVTAAMKAELTCSGVAVSNFTLEQQFMASDHAGLSCSPQWANRKSAAWDTD